MASTSSAKSDECPIVAKKAKTQNLVNILITDKQLLTDWTKLSDSLECSTQEKLEWEQGIKTSNLRYYNLISDILNSWTSRNPNKTINDLCQVLKDIGCINAAEKLQDNMRNGSLVQQQVFTYRHDKIRIKDVVNIFVKDSLLLQNWYEFSDSLESEVQDKAKWEQVMNNSTLNYEDVFSQILQRWITPPDLKKRTVEELCQVLKQMKCFSVAGVKQRKDYSDLAGARNINNPVQWKGLYISIPWVGYQKSREWPKWSGFSVKRRNYLAPRGETLETSLGKGSLIHLNKATTKYFNKFIRSEREIPWPVLHGLMAPASNFTGRNEELQKLSSIFNSRTNLTLICGIGKTELCKKFANDISNFVPISCVWFHGETFQTLLGSILKLAEKLGVTHLANPSPSIYFDYLASMILEKSERLLVIIDNVDVQYEEVTKVIKTIKVVKNERIFFIVTSRNRALLKGAGFTITLDILPVAHSRLMLQRSMTGLTNSDADKLGELVQYFPLALQQGIAYIKQQRNNFDTPDYNVSSYINEFDAKNKKFKMLNQRLNEFEHDYTMTMYFTWDMTINKINGSAFEILKILSYLEPDGVELLFLRNIFSRLSKTNLLEHFDAGLHIILNYSLVKVQNEVVSTHRLIQEVMRLKTDNFEYPKMLFESILLACQKFENLGIKEKPSGSELAQLRSVHKWAFKVEMGRIDYFCQVLLFLLEQNRFYCTVEYMKLHLKNIQINPDLNDKGKKEFLEKVILCGILKEDSCLADNDLLTNTDIETGAFKCNLYCSSGSLLGIASNLSHKYFGDTGKLNITFKNELSRHLLRRGEFDRALTICDELGTFPSFDDDQKEAYFQTINSIVMKVSIEKPTLTQIYRIGKILFHLVEIYPKQILNILKLKGEAQLLKEDNERSIELFQRYRRFGQEEEYNLIHQKIKLSTNEITKEEIEREFSEADYKRFSIKEIENIELFYNKILGKDHPLVIKVKMVIAQKVQNKDKKQCINLCKQVLESPVDGEYNEAMKLLSDAEDIEYDEQKILLEKLLKEKELKLGRKHSNTVRVMDLLAKLMEELKEFPSALKLFEQVRNCAIQCNWSENDLNESRVNVARLKLRLGHFHNLLTRDDIYREFGEFDDYRSFSLEQLEKVLLFYKRLLGSRDKLTLRVKNVVAGKLYYREKNSETLALVEQVITSSDEEIELEIAYNTMQDVGERLLHYYKDFEKSKELLERVVHFKMCSFGKNHPSTLTAQDVLAQVCEKFGTVT